MPANDLPHQQVGEAGETPVLNGSPVEQAAVVEAPPTALTPANALQQLRRSKPEVRLPGDNYPISLTAADIGRRLASSGLYYYQNAVGKFKGTPPTFETMRDQTFRTFIEKHVFCIGYRDDGKKQVVQSMSQDVAQTVLASEQFVEQIPQIDRILPCQLPVRGADGQPRLSPLGYDKPTGFYTLPSPAIKTGMSVDEARAIILDLFSEFPFVDKQQGLAVAVAATLNLYCAGLLPDACLRPVFLVVANAEGAGKSLLCSAAIIPVLGYAPVGAKPEREEELAKRIVTLMKMGRSVLLLDNVKKTLDSATLEGFTTSSVWSDRQLGSNTEISGTHNITTYITGNGLGITPDMRRRALSVELCLEYEKAEDRRFKRNLSDSALRAMRPALLGALWVIVKHWFDKGCPPASQGHSSFVEWAAVVAAIVECGGFGNCLAPSALGAPLDRDSDDMRRLVKAMAAQAKRFKFEELCALAQEQGCFESIFGISSGDVPHELEGEGFNLPRLDRRQNSQFDKLLKRYENRLFAGLRFAVEGVGHSRRYFVIENPPQADSSLTANTQKGA
jgi:hypothetical protein